MYLRHKVERTEEWSDVPRPNFQYENAIFGLYDVLWATFRLGFSMFSWGKNIFQAFKTIVVSALRSRLTYKWENCYFWLQSVKESNSFLVSEHKLIFLSYLKYITLAIASLVKRWFDFRCRKKDTTQPFYFSFEIVCLLRKVTAKIKLFCLLSRVILCNILVTGYLNPIPTGFCQVTLIYGLIPPMAGRNRVNSNKIGHKCLLTHFLVAFVIL